MNPGIYHGMSFEEYLAIPAINKSSLCDIERSPLHFFDKHLAEDREPREETKAMFLGTAIHTSILEPAKFASNYVVAPKVDRRTKEGKATWEAFVTENPTKLHLTEDEYDTCTKISARARENESAQVIMESGESEAVIIWNDPETGLLCKARMDWLNRELLTCLDFKSCESAQGSDFARQVINYDWHVQAAWYVDGYKCAMGDDLTFIFGALEKTRPFASAYYNATSEILNLGRARYRKFMRIYYECVTSGVWPSYDSEIKPLKLPAWALKQNDEPVMESF